MPTKKQWNKIGTVVITVVLVLIGISGTLTAQNVYSNIKTQGVTEFKKNSCDIYAKDGQKWLECDL